MFKDTTSSPVDPPKPFVSPQELHQPGWPPSIRTTQSSIGSTVSRGTAYHPAQHSQRLQPPSFPRSSPFFCSATSPDLSSQNKTPNDLPVLLDPSQDFHINLGNQHSVLCRFPGCNKAFASEEDIAYVPSLQQRSLCDSCGVLLTFSSRHTKTHTQPSKYETHPCPVKGCRSPTNRKRGMRKSDLRKHIAKQHPLEASLYISLIDSGQLW